MNAFTMKKMKEIKIEGEELILVWNKGEGCATEMRFAINDIESLVVTLKDPDGDK